MRISNMIYIYIINNISKYRIYIIYYIYYMDKLLSIIIFYIIIMRSNIICDRSFRA